MGNKEDQILQPVPYTSTAESESSSVESDSKSVSGASVAPSLTDEGSETISATQYQPVEDATGKKNHKRTKKIGLSAFILFTSTAIAVMVIFWKVTVPVTINITPDNISHWHLSIDEASVWKIFDSYRISPGNRKLSIEAKGYRTLNDVVDIVRKVDIDKDKLQPKTDTNVFSYTLEPLPGLVKISTKPVVEMELLINDKIHKPLNQTDYIYEIAQGEHAISVRSEYYKLYKEIIMVAGYGSEQTIEVELEPAWADIQFDTQPPGAKIVVDGRSIGNTPGTYKILEGLQKIRLEKEGFKAWNGELIVQAEVDYQFPLIELQPQETSIQIKSIPNGVSVFMIGEYKGETPIELEMPAAVSQRFTLRKHGYQDLEQNIIIEKGERKVLELTLEPQLSNYFIEVHPKNAQVYVNGKNIGNGSQSIDLTHEKHEIEVRSSDYQSRKYTVDPNLEKSGKIVINLLTINSNQSITSQVKPATVSTPTSISTFNQHQFKLFRPNGNYTLGSSRREVGRRANEKLTTVVLSKPFYMSLHAVTNEQYKAFESAHSSGDASGESLNTTNQPVVNITWEQAALYCNWLSKHEGVNSFYIVEGGKVVGFVPSSIGYRLPSESEWSYVARNYIGAKELKNWQTYAWGGSYPPTRRVGNYADTSARHSFANVVPGYSDGFKVSAPVGSYASNPNGVYDMDGNVFEWVNDVYQTRIAADSNSRSVSGYAINPLGSPKIGGKNQFHVIRGASWKSGTLTEIRLAYRDYHSSGRNDVGFRIARYAK